MTRWFLLLMVVALAGGAGCGKKKADKSKADETAQPVEAAQPAEGAPAAQPGAESGQPTSAETGGQSFADGMKALCNPEIDKAAPASERQMKMASWIKDHVSNPEVIQLFQSMGELPPAEREAAMDQAIAKAGLTSCPIAGK